MSGDYTCVAFVGDRVLCGEAASIRRPVPLCDEHKVIVALSIVPELLKSTLRGIRAQREDGTQPLSRAEAHMVDSAPLATWPETEKHPRLVYFLANGGRVKIGHTNCLPARIRVLSLREDAALLLLQGGPRLERALHTKFAKLRIADSEWFELAPEIVRFVGHKTHGKPPARPTPLAEDAPPSTRRSRPRRREPRVEAEIQQVFELIRTHGYERVDLRFIQTELNLKQTTAWDRLVEGRKRWDEAALGLDQHNDDTP
ncbi:GIY-YIG nuclease family protein [Streptomyces sp. bgisy159]|uniref:GIY-YIG nuclease family protein n=1 Tax=Streptomyces sp. bgisy159 TaxID=3413795 RepID=UPI003F4A74BD